MKAKKITDPILATQNWLEKIVIGLNLCPFARAPFRSGRIRFVLEPTELPEVLFERFAEEALLLIQTPVEKTETTLLIHPNVLLDFIDYNNALFDFEQLIRELDLEGILQVASFHPDYQFAQTHPEDAENYTNRSPFPMLHLIREDSISRAVDLYPDIDQIPERNIERMNELGVEGVKKLLGY